MKVVLFCGGQGMRMREVSEHIPKPMVEIGDRPVMWHVMRYYAALGHKEFILCLGYKAQVIKDYFVRHAEYRSTDFVLNGDGSMELLDPDIPDWKITFVDTGNNSCIGERLWKVRQYVQDDEMFLANYSDNLTDYPLGDLIEKVEATGAIAGFLSVRPPHSFHVTSVADNGVVECIEDTQECEIWINGGNFVLRREIFDYMREGEELVLEPFQRLIQEQRLVSQKYSGFWQNMDTFKDHHTLNGMLAKGNAPWQIWL
jgi:glucose-1-phosphate cytidylyltransferase